MSLSEPFIRRPIGTALLAIGLLMTGVAAFPLLPIAPFSPLMMRSAASVQPR